MDKLCVHCYISGLVQGVFYRANTKKTARALGLTGWVRNLNDGRVEVLACGEKDKVDVLINWLNRGPKSARVDGVSVEEKPYQQFNSFKVV